MIGNVIQTKRKEVGLTQVELADMLGVTAPAVNKWEKDLCFPDASLLAPLARILKTDLNELFSFYSLLSDKDREILIDELRDKALECGYEEVKAFIDEIILKNPVDGKLFKDIADSLYGIYLLKYATNPEIYLPAIADYYEKALQYSDENTEEVIYSLMNVYSELGDREKAENAWEKMPSAKYEKKWAHAEMLYSLKEYEAALAEIKEIILRKVIDLSGNLDLLKNAYHLSGNDDMSDFVVKKTKEFRDVFELWNGFDSMSDVTGAFVDHNVADEEQALEDLILSASRDEALTTSPLFEGVKLGCKNKGDATTADIMADLMTAISSLKK